MPYLVCSTQGKSTQLHLLSIHKTEEQALEALTQHALAYAPSCELVVLTAVFYTQGSTPDD